MAKNWIFKFVWLLTFALANLASYANAAETVVYFHSDVSGSPLVATDAAGNVVWKENYRPYGERTVKAPVASDNSLWFTGKPVDEETGLSYIGARYYSSVLGRFMGVDPEDFSESNIHSFNRYAYGNNNPYKYVDPDGRFALPIVWGAIAGGALITSAAIYNYTQNPQAKAAADRVLNWINSITWSQSISADAGKAGSATGCIYLCDGVTAGQRTPSGRPYVGSADDKDARARGARDGREREGAKIIDEYQKGDRDGRRNAEQKGINNNGGKGALDNKRDEVAGSKWGERGINSPKDKE